MARMLFVVLCFVAMPGCEITASVFVQKDWNTDPSLYKANDMTTKAELKVSKLIGKDAKK